MDSVTVPWFAELVIISYRTVTKKQRPPLPSELLATFLVFGTFTLISARQPRIGSALGWGVVIATGLNLFGAQDKLTNPLGKTTQPQKGKTP